MSDQYEVIVGNVGNVFRDSRYEGALAVYEDYVEMSTHNVGRAGGEEVVIMFRGDVVREYIPPATHSDTGQWRVEICRSSCRSRVIFADGFERLEAEAAALSLAPNEDFSENSEYGVEYEVISSTPA